MDRMRASPNFVDVDTDYLVGMPEVEVVPNRKLAADLGVSMQDIGDTVNALVGGVRAVRFKDQGKRYDVNALSGFFVRVSAYFMPASARHFASCLQSQYALT